MKPASERSSSTLSLLRWLIRCGASLGLCGLLSLAIFAQLPTFSFENFAPSVKAQIRQVYDEAKANPHDANAVGKLGMTLHAYEEYQAAVNCYERARTLAPQEFRWIYYLGIAQAKLGRHDEAVAALQAALRLQANYLPAQIKFADSLFELKKNEEAEALYLEASKKNPTAIFAWYGLGRVKAVKHDVNAAINCFERAVALAPQFGAAHYALALALRDAGRIGKAKEHLALYQQHQLERPAAGDVLLAEIAALNTSAPEYLNQGLALAAEGKLASSIAAHEKALAINPNLTQAQINLIQLYGRIGQAEQAEQQYRRVTESYPNLADAHYNFGVFLLSQQKPQDAAAAFTRTLAINPHFAEAHHNLGVLYLQETKLEDAAREFQAALASNPNYRQAHFELGRILVHQRKLDVAITHFQQTLEPEDRDTPRYLYALAATYLRAGNQAEGLQFLQRAKQRATAYGQKELLASIDRDLKTLEENK